MYYYLLYNSSFSFIVENRLFSTILYGSILYILTHAVLNYCDVSILNIINNYFWTTLTHDVISLSYAIYNSFMYSNSNSNSNNSSGDSNNLNVSFNLLKNKINTILDRKNDLTITQVSSSNQTNNNNNNTNTNTNTKDNVNTNLNLIQNKKTSQTGNYIQENFKNIDINSTNPIDEFDFSDLDDVIQPPHLPLSQLSTPISHLQSNKKNIKQQAQQFQSSTPLNLIRSNIKIEPPLNQDDMTYNSNSNSNGNSNGNGNGNSNGNESVAGSDVGSIMDLEDFEKSF
jgi:hypothetical protein